MSTISFADWSPQRLEYGNGRNGLKRFLQRGEIFLLHWALGRRYCWRSCH
jgi:hypothetical protein